MYHSYNYVFFQTITMHLLHHLVRTIRAYGPVFGRWLFAHERANSWYSRQVLNKKDQEATIVMSYLVRLCTLSH